LSPKKKELSYFNIFSPQGGKSVTGEKITSVFLDPIKNTLAAKIA
jgi:hypothetical protein